MVAARPIRFYSAGSTPMFGDHFFSTLITLVRLFCQSFESNAVQPGIDVRVELRWRRGVIRLFLCKYLLGSRRRMAACRQYTHIATYPTRKGHQEIMRRPGPAQATDTLECRSRRLPEFELCRKVCRSGSVTSSVSGLTCFASPKSSTSLYRDD